MAEHTQHKSTNWTTIIITAIIGIFILSFYNMVIRADAQEAKMEQCIADDVLSDAECIRAYKE